MLVMYDYECSFCGALFEEIVSSTDSAQVVCPFCGEYAQRTWVKGPSCLTEIIPTYPGCKKQKAGYVHTHGDRSATKIMSGPGGVTAPKK